jgi:hypothetical protein
MSGEKSREKRPYKSGEMGREMSGDFLTKSPL